MWDERLQENVNGFFPKMLPAYTKQKKQTHINCVNKLIRAMQLFIGYYLYFMYGCMCDLWGEENEQIKRNNKKEQFLNKRTTITYIYTLTLTLAHTQTDSHKYGQQNYSLPKSCHWQRNCQVKANGVKLPITGQDTNLTFVLLLPIIWAEHRTKPRTELNAIKCTCLYASYFPIHGEKIACRFTEKKIELELTFSKV